MKIAVAALVALVATPAAAASVQADFDAAQALFDAGKMPEARAAFTALLARFPASSNGRAVNIVRSRLGAILVETADGDAAEPLLKSTIAYFKAPTPADAEERNGALYDLGRVYEWRGAIDSAREAYRKVEASGFFAEDGKGGIALRSAIARTSIWSDPDAARRLLDTLLALPRDKLGAKPGDTVAMLRTLRGRVELNNGNPAEAKRWFTEATFAAGGGATLRINVADVRTRGDLAIANFRLKKFDEVQKNMALSGAGTMVLEGLSLAKFSALPKCTPLSGLAPDAFAIIEFAIDDNGRTVGVTPVFADVGSGARGGPNEGPEAVFAEAVRNWSWDAATVKKLEPFWRQSVRVEVRCFNDRPPGDPVYASYSRAFNRWLAAAGVVPAPAFDGTDATRLPAIRAELARREAASGTTSVQLLPPLYQLIINAAVGDKELSALHERRVAVLVANQAPPDVLATARLDAIGMASTAGKTRKDRALLARTALTTLLAELVAAGRSDSPAAMATRLRLAEAHDDSGDVAAAAALYRTIADAPTTVLPEADAIRTAALLHIANQAAAARDTAKAAEALAATGLTAEQCALVDTRPQPVNTSIGQAVFPAEAMRWGNNGIVKVAFDITAEGKPTNVRTVLASPPLIYSSATEGAIAKFQYRPVFRPGNTLGCTANLQSVRLMTRAK